MYFSTCRCESQVKTKVFPSDTKNVLTVLFSDNWLREPHSVCPRWRTCQPVARQLGLPGSLSWAVMTRQDLLLYLTLFMLMGATASGCGQYCWPVYRPALPSNLWRELREENEQLGTKVCGGERGSKFICGQDFPKP